ncbi:hypothetical protein CIPAW_03G018100 [Carya illinoinensis]|uniref:Uncharacterized protein n=1 Tax=Carya illinoinensis TaxID=32201 RepID=A0A8T1QXS5_CARIL|nr:hypothetical protein CIPAW_03G018100 [Carya illinoinensis]
MSILIVDANPDNQSYFDSMRPRERSTGRPRKWLQQISEREKSEEKILTLESMKMTAIVGEGDKEERQVEEKGLRVEEEISDREKRMKTEKGFKTKKEKKEKLSVLEMKMMKNERKERAVGTSEIIKYYLLFV